MTDDELMTIEKAAIETLLNIPMGQVFSGSEFKVMLCENYPQFINKYVASILRPLFVYNKDKNKECAAVCINRHNSIYKKVSAEEYDKTHSLEKRVLLTESRFNELLDIEWRYLELQKKTKKILEENKTGLKQQEFNFD